MPKQLNRAPPLAVALRKESVDRNYAKETPPHRTQRSLSARRAWIEICYLDNIEITQAVALRKESVDRNPGSYLVRNAKNGSLSARRAWIEIADVVSVQYSGQSRSPQGERG